MFTTAVIIIIIVIMIVIRFSNPSSYRRKLQFPTSAIIKGNISRGEMSSPEDHYSISFTTDLY